MPDVRSMCAIGLSGQLGLDGHLPWEGDRRPEFEADVARFFDLTRGHVLMAGPRTIGAVPKFAHADRTLVTLRSGDDPQTMLDRFPGRVVYIAAVRPCGTPTPASSATGTSPGCRTTARPTAGSNRAGY
jgi:dihydromethanopterin reductase